MELSIKELGIELQKTKSREVFEIIFNRLKNSVLYTFRTLPKTSGMCEDAYNDAMLSVWNTIDDIDVEKYSISTIIYIKTRQCIIRANTKLYGTVGLGGSMFHGDEDFRESGSSWEYYRSGGTRSLVTTNRDNQQHYAIDKIGFITNKQIDDVFKNIEIVDIIHDIKFGTIVYDHYYNSRKYKDLAEDYGISIEIVKNRIYHGKANLKKYLKAS